MKYLSKLHTRVYFAATAVLMFAAPLFASVITPELEQRVLEVEYDIEAEALPNGNLILDSAITFGTGGEKYYRDIYMVDSMTDNTVIHVHDWEDGAWRENYRIVYRKTADGHPQRYSYFTRDKDQWTESTRREYAYDMMNRKYQEFYYIRDSLGEWNTLSRATFNYDYHHRVEEWVYDINRDEMWSPYAKYKYTYNTYGHRSAAFCYHLPTGSDRWKLTSEYELYQDTTIGMVSQIYCDYSGLKATCPSRCDMYYDKENNLQVQLFFYSDKQGAWIHNATTYNYYHMDESDTIWNTVKSGAFSVSDTRAVRFAPGNLQYQPSTHTFRFAEQQSDVIGDDNARIVTARSTRAWIDLFGWATALRPDNHSDDITEYGDFLDWGIHRIGDFVPNTWHTLTADEWDYLFHGRYRAEELYGAGRVNGSYGIIILPDTWEAPKNFSFKPGIEGWEDNKFNLKQWQPLEELGAIFLPVGGHRNGANIYHAFENGFYWSTTPNQGRTAFALGVNQEFIDPRIDEPRPYGLLVRLVRETEKPEIVIVEEEIDPKAAKKKTSLLKKSRTE